MIFMIIDGLRQALGFEHKALIILYFMSYIGAMVIQLRDPKTEVHYSDWFLALITSAVGGTITYFIVMGWTNIGFRMGMTIVASLVSYRTFKFIVSNEAQDQFASGFFKGIMEILSRLFNGNTKDDK